MKSPVDGSSNDGISRQTPVEQQIPLSICCEAGATAWPEPCPWGHRTEPCDDCAAAPGQPHVAWCSLKPGQPHTSECCEVSEPRITSATIYPGAASGLPMMYGVESDGQIAWASEPDGTHNDEDEVLRMVTSSRGITYAIGDNGTFRRDVPVSVFTDWDAHVESALAVANG